MQGLKNLLKEDTCKCWMSQLSLHYLKRPSRAFSASSQLADWCASLPMLTGNVAGTWLTVVLIGNSAAQLREPTQHRLPWGALSKETHQSFHHSTLPAVQCEHCKMLRTSLKGVDWPALLLPVLTTVSVHACSVYLCVCRQMVFTLGLVAPLLLPLPPLPTWPSSVWPSSLWSLPNVSVSTYTFPFFYKKPSPPP